MKMPREFYFIFKNLLQRSKPTLVFILTCTSSVQESPDWTHFCYKIVSSEVFHIEENYIEKREQKLEFRSLGRI